MMTYQRETLVAKLRERGITYLAPSDAQATEIIPNDETLIMALLQQDDSRLKLALINIFIRHPELAQSVANLVEQVDATTKIDLQTLYMAAVYLQRLWRSRLEFYLGKSELLPDLYSAQLDLPQAGERFGKVGLYALAEAWKARSVYPFNRLASLNKTIDMFFEQLKIEKLLHRDSRREISALLRTNESTQTS